MIGVSARVSLARVSAGVIAAMALGLGAALSSPTLATSGPLVVIAAFLEWRRRRRNAERQRVEGELLQLVDQMIEGLRSGLSLREACLRFSTTDPPKPLVPLVVHLRSGQTLAFAANRLLTEPTLAFAANRLLTEPTLAFAANRLLTEPSRHHAGVRSARLLGVTLAVLANNGGPAVPALQRLRHCLAGAAHGRRRADAESAQATASAGLLVSAPVLFAAAVAGIDPAAAHLYLFEAIGALCVFGALALSSFGWWWMQTTTDRAVRSMW